MATLSDEELNRIANEGDALNRVNTILGRNPTPGVGAPGSTPQSDAGNLEIGRAMDKADLGNRFGFGSQEYLQGTENPANTQPDAGAAGGIDIGLINQRRNQILQGVDPDQPAIFPSNVPGKHGISRKQELMHELGTLTNIVHDNILDTARTSHEDLVNHRTIQVATQSDNIFKGLQQITPDGSPESEKAFLDLVNQNRLAADVSPAVRAELKRHAQIHDRAATPIAPQVDPATGMAWNGSRWVSPPLVPGGATAKAKPNPVATELLTHHKITPTELLSPDAKVLYGSVTGTGDKAAFVPDSGGKTGGKIAQIDTGEGKPPVRMLASEYARYKTAFTPKQDAGAAKHLGKYNPATGNFE